MKTDERDLLAILKAELEFLTRGGYAQSLGASWRPPLIFEDSPTCLNFGCKEKLVACADCVLMQLVAPEVRSRKIPCRRILLTACGESLEDLYRTGTGQEIEEAVAVWLRATIQSLETERRADRAGVSVPSCRRGSNLKHETTNAIAVPAESI
jgi:hypothetical protein